MTATGPTQSARYAERLVLAMLPKALKVSVAFAGDLDSSAARLCGLLFQTLPVYGDLASQKAVLATVRSALGNETFLRTFAATLLRTDGARVSRQESFILFLWSCAVLQVLQLPAAAKAALKLLERQVMSHEDVARCWQCHACSVDHACPCAPWSAINPA